MADKPADIGKLIEEVEAVIGWFESDEVDLNQALARYEEALKKLEQIQDQLKAAKLKVERINKKFDA